MNSKGKGSSFERKVAKELSRWITGGKRDDVLWRTSISGGRATVARKKGKEVRQSGDLCAVAPEGHAFCDAFYMELKHYRDLQIDKFLIYGEGILAKFWAKAHKEAVLSGKEPLMIIRQNGWPILVLSKPCTFPTWLVRTISNVNLKVEVCDFMELTTEVYKDMCEVYV